MLDLKFLRDHLTEVGRALADRNSSLDLSGFERLEEDRRALIREVEELKAARNQASREVAEAKRAGLDTQPLIDSLSGLSERIRDRDDLLRRREDDLRDIQMSIPNLPHASVPRGKSEADNQLIRTWGEKPVFDFPPREHWEIGQILRGLDLERAAKITGARFALTWGPMARLERALINFMLDMHTREHGYLEVHPPYIVNSASLFGTGQLPKFADELFRIEGGDYYLIPTAEVPVTNIFRDEIIASELPLGLCAYTPCFRSEAGSYGRDTKGIIRQHQFNKVELVRFVPPEISYDQLELLTSHAEAVLQRLGLPYRVVALCTGDLGFSAAKTYDLEVWLPGANAYREVSSCSNFEDFQARRASIRFRPGEARKPVLVHTLNGSGLPVGRTMLALLENFQQADGSVIVPEALRPYMDEMEVIEPWRNDPDA